MRCTSGFCFPLYKLVHDPYDVSAWHLFLLLPQWYLVFAPLMGVIGHREMRIQVKRFVVGDWENLQKELFL
jgi:hypothetical protein